MSTARVRELHLHRKYYALKEALGALAIGIELVTP